MTSPSKMMSSNCEKTRVARPDQHNNCRDDRERIAGTGARIRTIHTMLAGLFDACLRSVLRPLAVALLVQVRPSIAPSRARSYSLVGPSARRGPFVDGANSGETASKQPQTTACYCGPMTSTPPGAPPRPRPACQCSGLQSFFAKNGMPLCLYQIDLASCSSGNSAKPCAKRRVGIGS